MREFALSLPIGSPAALVSVPMTGTPPLSFNKTAAFAEWLRTHAASIEAGENELPIANLAQTSLVPTSTFRWEAPDANPKVRAAFSMSTCSGCHAGERGPDPLTFQHIAPGKTAYYGSGSATLLSRFLHNPGHEDELSRRETALREAACSPCGVPDAGGAGDGGTYGMACR